MTLRTSVCQHCRKPLTFVQYHAGFSDQGFLYCGKDGTVLTWSSYDRHYTAVAMDKHPWMLDDDERDRVEKRLRRCPCGGTFALQESSALSALSNGYFVTRFGQRSLHSCRE